MSFLMMCQGCGATGDKVAILRLRAKGYTGPCGDSFCYASCDSPSCRPLDCVLCDECAGIVTNVGVQGLKRSPMPIESSESWEEISAYFHSIEVFNGDQISMVFRSSMREYDKSRSVGGLVCSTVKLRLKEEKG